MRISTFNLENLFNRYLYLDDSSAPDEKKFLPTGVAGFDRFGGIEAKTTTLIQRNNTARIILDTKPDILGVVEVEDLRALRLFNDEYLSNYFDRMIMLEGNDGRGINVGLCIRRGFDAAVVGIRSHADEALKKGWTISRYFDPKDRLLKAGGSLFSRDCLEVEIDVGAVKLTVLMNHLKSQSGANAQEKRAARELRQTQANRVAELVLEVKKRGRLPIVLGDLNADWDKDKEKENGAEKSSLQALKDLVGKNELVDPFPEGADRWTHFFMVANSVSRLDYILIDPAVAKDAKASYERRGMSLKCEQAGKERYPSIGYVDTEASDHCAISVDLKLELANA